MNTKTIRNASGYPDPTVDSVIKREYLKNKNKVENEAYILMKQQIKKYISDNGYVLEGPISLIKVSNGKRKRIY